jgi:hypothetical protein
VIVGAVVAIALIATLQTFGALNQGRGSGASPACAIKPSRQSQAAELMKAGAVITYERNGGSSCVDELYAVYPDGRIVGDNGTQTIEKTAAPADVQAQLGRISDLGWFTDNMFSTSHTPCAQCYTYFTGVAHGGQEKIVEAVDGGTDAPANYWLVSGMLSTFLPTFSPAPQ